MQKTESFIHWPKQGTLLLVGALEGPENAIDLALEFTRRLLSEHNQSDPLFDSNVHPDFYWLKPEKNSQSIKIDQVRALIIWAEGKPQIASRKIAIISCAHALNLQAANALLKTLEEAPIDTLFILVSNKPSFLPATIRSRAYCIRLKSAASPNDSADFLELKAEILKDLENLSLDKTDVVAISNRWIKQSPKSVLDAWQAILYDKLKQEALEEKILRNKKYWKLLDKIVAAKRSLEDSNPNLQLLLESLLIF